MIQASRPQGSSLRRDHMTIKAQIATVQIGPLSMEGLMSECGRFGVAISQYADLFETSRNTASRDLKRLLDKVFQTSIEFEQWKTPFNQKAVNVILLESWSLVIIELAFSGNLKAMNLVRDLHEMSWHQLFCDAFQIKFEEEDRQKYLRERAVHRSQYHPLLTSWLQKDGCSKDWEYGQRVNEFKKAGGLPVIPIAQYSADEMSRLNQVEGMYDIMRRAGHDHNKSVGMLVR